MELKIYERDKIRSILEKSCTFCCEGEDGNLGFGDMMPLRTRDYWDFLEHIVFGTWVVGINKTEANLLKRYLVNILDNSAIRERLVSGITHFELSKLICSGSIDAIKLIALGGFLKMWDIVTPKDYIIRGSTGLGDRLEKLFLEKGMIIVSNYGRAGGVHVKVLNIGACNGSCYVHSKCTHTESQSKRAIHLILNSCDDANRLKAMFPQNSFNPQIELDGNNVINAYILGCECHENNLEKLYDLIITNDDWVTLEIIEQSTT